MYSLNKKKKKKCELSVPVELQPPDMCSVLLCALCHILNKLKVQVEGRSTAARGQRREPGCEQSSLHEAAGPLLTAPRPHTHCPHSAAIWPAGKSEPPETRPNT